MDTEQQSSALEARLNEKKQEPSKGSRHRIGASRLSASIEGSTLHRRRSTNPNYLMKPVLQEQRSTQNSLRSGVKTAKQREQSSLEHSIEAKTTIQSQVQNRNRVMMSHSSRRQVFSTHQNRDLVSLGDKEVTNVLEERPQRPPISNLTRRKVNNENSVSATQKKQQAIKCLLNDKTLATELIRLYSNNVELRQSQKKLAIATKQQKTQQMKPPRPRQDLTRISRNISKQQKAVTQSNNLTRESMVRPVPTFVSTQTLAVRRSQARGSISLPSSEHRQVEKLFRKMSTANSPLRGQRQYSNLSNLYKPKQTTHNGAESSAVKFSSLNLQSKLRHSKSANRVSVPESTNAPSQNATSQKDLDASSSPQRETNGDATQIQSSNSRQQLSVKRSRLQSARNRNFDVFQDQVISMAQGRAGKRIRPQSSKPSMNGRQRRGAQVQQFSQRQFVDRRQHSQRSNEDELDTTAKLSQGDQTSHIDLTRADKKYLHNTRLIDQVSERQAVESECKRNELIESRTTQIYNEPIVEKRARKRPTTAPRARPVQASSEFGADQQVQVAIQSSSGKSQRKIKTYLQREYSQNKYLSINDYKVMTKQVMNLKHIEDTYLSESLTAMNNRIFQVPNQSLPQSSITSKHLQFQQLNRRVKESHENFTALPYKQPRRQKSMQNKHVSRRMRRRRRTQLDLNKHEKTPNQIIDIISSNNSVLLKSELEDNVNENSILAQGKRAVVPQSQRQSQSSYAPVNKGSSVFKNVNELSQIGEEQILQMRLAIHHKDMQIAERKTAINAQSRQDLDLTMMRDGEYQQMSQTFQHPQRRTRPQTAKPLTQNRSFRAMEQGSQQLGQGSARRGIQEPKLTGTCDLNGINQIDLNNSSSVFDLEKDSAEF